MNDVRARFLKAILDRLPLDRIVEIHFFPSIRQGPIETGVAVIAAHPEPVLVHAEDAAVVDDAADVFEKAPADDSPYAAELPAELADTVGAADDPAHPGRHVVYTASYRWTRKGPDRGKWEADVIPTADAPLPTVDVVVRGVMERTGDSETLESQRLTGEELAALIASPEWQTAP